MTAKIEEYITNCAGGYNLSETTINMSSHNWSQNNSGKLKQLVQTTFSLKQVLPLKTKHFVRHKISCNGPPQEAQSVFKHRVGENRMLIFYLAIRIRIPIPKFSKMPFALFVGISKPLCNLLQCLVCP